MQSVRIINPQINVYSFYMETEDNHHLQKLNREEKIFLLLQTGELSVREYVEQKYKKNSFQSLKTKNTAYY